MLVGNKADLSAERRVSFADAEQFASETGVSLYEVSAKTGINVEEAFAELATTMRQRVKSAAASLLHSEDSEPDLSSAFHVDGTGGKVKPSSWSNCCSSAPPPAFV